MMVRATIYLLAVLSVAACAPRLYVKDTKSPFPEVMASLQSAILQNGYTLSRVQRVDYGLTKRGFQTDKYRVVFFGKPEEISELSREFPELVPFLPLKITILENGDRVEMVSINPQRLASLYPEPQLQETFQRWQRDIQKILDDASRNL